MEHSKGSVAHSDGDVLIHAIIDALLGAVVLCDIGQHFPDTEEKWKDADSKDLLAHVNRLVRKKGYTISNIDSTICLERPKLKNHIPKMCTTLAGILSINVDQISIKATRGEQIGFVGREEGVKAYAVVLLENC